MSKEDQLTIDLLKLIFTTKNFTAQRKVEFYWNNLLIGLDEIYS